MKHLGAREEEYLQDQTQKKQDLCAKRCKHPEGATAADVRQAGEESYLDAADLGNESWSWIK